MRILTTNDYLGATRQKIRICKTASRTSVAAVPFSVFDLAWSPGAGTLAGTSTTAWVVPTDATAWCPTINDFAAWAKWYLTRFQMASSVAGRVYLYDMLFKAWAYWFAGGTTSLTGQPSYASRIPAAGTDYTGTEIWIEVSTAFATGTAWQVQVTYTNQSWVAGRTSIISTAQAAAGLTLGKMFQIALMAWDTGVQKIESVIVTNGGTAMTAGAFNVLVLRPLEVDWIRVVNGNSPVHTIVGTGAPEVFQDSALIIVAQPDSTATGTPEASIEISSK